MVWKAKTLVLGVTEGLLDQLRDVGVGEAVIDVRGLAAGLDDLGASQQREVPADGALRLSQGFNKSGHTALAPNQQQDKLHPDGFRQGLEDLADPSQVAWVGMF
jgi:hypothetical protein